MKKNISAIIALLLVICLLSAGCAAEKNSGDEQPGVTDIVATENTADISEKNETPDTGNGASGNEEAETAKPPVIDDSFRNWYEIFVYSFYDSDGNGCGDLNGVISKLDYVEKMGYTGIWFMPIHPSPSYHKYDVTDYYAIDPAYGTMEDFKKLVSEAHARDIDIILDLVVNHTSSEHPWFKAACDEIRKNGQPSGEYAEYYNFINKYDSGYSKVTGTDWYYESRFYYGMPDLNLDSEKVRDEIKNIMQYWFDLGVDGFRLDACTSFYTGSVDRNVEFLNWLSTTAHGMKEDCFLVGEAWENADSLIRRYYDSGLDSFFIFPSATGEGEIVKVLSFTAKNCGLKYNELLLLLQSIYDIGIRSMFLGNHDTARAANFLRRSMPARVKMGAGLLAMMPGAVFTYYGEEIGMIGKDSDPEKRIAMLWDTFGGEGYCTRSHEGIDVNADSYVFPSVADQEKDEDSILNYYRAAMRLRNENPEIARGTVSVLNGSDGVTAGDQVSVTKRSWNGSDIIVVINLNSTDAETVKIDKSVFGDISKCGELLSYRGVVFETGSREEIIADEAAGTYTLPAFSIMILR